MRLTLVTDGILVRAWRYLFARDSHEECRRSTEQERLARQWEREGLLRLVENLQAKVLELADPGITYRFQAQPKPPKPVEPRKKTDEVENFPGIG